MTPAHEAAHRIKTGPLVLAIVDGWGIAPPGAGNAATQAKTPNLDAWRKNYPYTQLAASGHAVGLTAGQDGNSEAGHMNIGAGRRVAQEDIRISSSIADGTFFRNPAFLAAVHHVESRQSTLHIMGMLGNQQSAHADPDHLLALLLFAQNHHLQNVRVHLFTDGRDSPQYYARDIISKFMPHLGDARIATVMGRFYAMDRNKTWGRTELAYRAMTEGVAPHTVDSVVEAITHAYQRGESDEFISPTVIRPYTGMHDGDAIVFYNLRSDRARQLTKAFVQDQFEAKNRTTHPFPRTKTIQHVTFVAMTDFGPDLGPILTAFPAETIGQTLPMVLGDLRQLYIAESEKYAHVTYFLNGGYAEAVANENREMIPSPPIKFYDQAPAMSSVALTNRVVQAVERHEFDVVVVNFAATDMIAHTGNFRAAVQAMETVDTCLGKIAAAVQAQNGVLVVTADHGNIEEMINLDTQEIDTEHSANPVPFILVSDRWRTAQLRAGGALSDIAPTVLALLHRRIPPLMTGRSLVRTA